MAQQLPFDEPADKTERRTHPKITKHTLRLVTLLSIFMLSACNSDYVNLPNISIDRSSSVSFDVLPTSLRSRDFNGGSSGQESNEANPFESIYAQRISSTVHAYKDAFERPHSSTLPLLKQNSGVIESRLRSTLKSRNRILQIQSILTQRCGFLSATIGCEVFLGESDTDFHNATIQHIVAANNTAFRATRATFVQNPSEFYDYELKLSYNSHNKVLHFSLRWNEGVNRIEESLQASWTDAESLREFNSTLTLMESDFTTLRESVSIDQNTVTSTQQLRIMDSDRNDVTLKTSFTWNTPTEKGAITIDVLANNVEGKSSTSFNNRVDGTHYSTLAKNEFDNQGVLIASQHCNNNGDLDCSLNSSWITTKATPTYD